MKNKLLLKFVMLLTTIILLLSSCVSSKKKFENTILEQVKKEKEYDTILLLEKININTSNYLLVDECGNGFYTFYPFFKKARNVMFASGRPIRFCFKYDDEVFVFLRGDKDINKKYIEKNEHLFNKLFNNKWRKIEHLLITGVKFRY